MSQKTAESSDKKLLLLTHNGRKMAMLGLSKSSGYGTHVCFIIQHNVRSFVFFHSAQTPNIRHSKPYNRQSKITNLDGCSLTGSCLAALWTSLSGTFSKLRNLNLRRNDLTDETLDLLSQVLQSGCCKLNTLSLNACGLTGSCCSALAAVLQSENCTLTDLDLSVNELEESGGMLICEALIAATCSMEKLSMVRCELTEPVFSALSTALISGVSSLKKLDIGLNQVGEAGAKHIWKSLKHPHCKLQHLDLEMLDLTDSCVDDLCEAVASCSSLTSIILKNNNLTDASVPRLVKLVQDRPALELNVQYNDFSEDVLEMMDVYPTIRY